MGGRPVFPEPRGLKIYMPRKNKGTPDNVASAAKILTSAGHYRHNLNTLFRDFISVTTLTLRNGFEPRDAGWHQREEAYLEIVGRYDRDILAAFAKCIATLTTLSHSAYGDHVGELYMNLELGSKALGQFFTPYHVSQLMAAMTIDKTNIEKAVKKSGYFTMNEPTAGAGGMAIAVAEVVKSLGYDPALHFRVVAQDIDQLCAQMTYINCALQNIPATIIWGDSLKLEEKETFHTPALYLQVARLHQNAA